MRFVCWHGGNSTNWYVCDYIISVKVEFTKRKEMWISPSLLLSLAQGQNSGLKNTSRREREKKEIKQKLFRRRNKFERHLRQSTTILHLKNIKQKQKVKLEWVFIFWALKVIAYIKQCSFALTNWFKGFQFVFTFFLLWLFTVVSANYLLYAKVFFRLRFVMSCLEINFLSNYFFFGKSVPMHLIFMFFGS